jgi:phosphoribosylformylglycinamidine (FGAM) synthase-like enzyme
MTEPTDAAHLPIPDAPASDADLREVALSRAEYHQAVEMLGRYPTRVELGMIGAL